MPRTSAKISQADVARVLRALAQSGMQMRVRILPDGQIVMEPVEVAAAEVQYKGDIKLW